MKRRNSKEKVVSLNYTTVMLTKAPKRGLYYRCDGRLYFISLPPEENLPKDFDINLCNLIEEDMAQGLHDATLERYQLMIKKNVLSNQNAGT